MGYNKEFDVKGKLWGVLLIVRGGEHMTMEHSSLTALGHQLLKLMKFRFLLTRMEPVTQTCGGSVIDTFALGPTGNVQNPILWFFIMAKGEILISVDNDGTLVPNLWGGR